jgi:hypothetical protein
MCASGLYVAGDARPVPAPRPKLPCRRWCPDSTCVPKIHLQTIATSMCLRTMYAVSPLLSSLSILSRRLRTPLVGTPSCETASTHSLLRTLRFSVYEPPAARVPDSSRGVAAIRDAQAWGFRYSVACAPPRSSSSFVTGRCTRVRHLAEVHSVCMADLRICCIRVDVMTARVARDPAGQNRASAFCVCCGILMTESSLHVGRLIS